MIIHSYLSNFHHNIRKNPDKYKLSSLMAIQSHREPWDENLFYKKCQILVKNSKKSNINTHSTVNIRQIMKKSWKSLNRIIINHPKWKLAFNGLNLVVLLILNTVRDFRSRDELLSTGAVEVVPWLTTPVICCEQSSCL